MQSQNTNPPVLEDSNNNLAQDSEAPKKTATNMPYIIEYCPHCTFPPEFCEFSSCYSKCKTFLQEKYPQYLKDETVQQETNTEKPVGEENKEETKKEEEPAEDKTKKKVSIKEEKKIEITLKKRNNKKFLTLINGLESFDIKVKDAAKKFGKKFACGSSVVENNGIEIQGDVTDDIIAYISKEFSISEDSIVIKEKKA